MTLRNVLSISVTDAGRRAASMLPFEHVHGSLAATVRDRWAGVDAFVLFAATGVAVRVVGPLLEDKRRDPAIVCVDEARRFAIALSGGHGRRANALATEVAALLGAEPVVTTASDASGQPALDLLPGYIAEGDVAGFTRAWLDGAPPVVSSELPNWPLPATLASGPGPHRVIVSDRAVAPADGLVLLRPPSLVIGVGTSTAAPPAEVRELVEATLAAHGLAAESVAEVATIDRRATEPALLALDLPLRTYTPDELAAVEVPTPSDVVSAAVGTPSVAEAAALLAGGPGAELVVAKQKNRVATVAVVRRARPRGHLAVVGLGPGGPAHRTPAAATAVRSAEVVIGYTPYVEQCADLLTAAQDVIRSPIGSEVDRARQSLELARAGRSVAMVCSGDAGIYAMASIILEEAGSVAPEVEVTVVPGVTAALAAAAALGAPLGHDHVAISLSDLLTPWAAIEGRLRAAAESDLVVSLYNPRSKGRTWQLEAARDLLLTGRPGFTPVGIVTDAGREGEQVTLTTLASLDPELVGMTTCVLVGASTTRVVAGRMVTPRGYHP